MNPTRLQVSEIRWNCATVAGMTSSFSTALFVGLCLAASPMASAQESPVYPGYPTEQGAYITANNPIASATSLNIQNEYIGNLSDIDESGNILNLRAIQPFSLGGEWVARATLPVVTLPTPPDLDSETGIGDFNVFALKLIDVGRPTVTVGFGPSLTVPSATNDALGNGTWNAGLANVLFNFTNPRFQWGYLAVWETDFAKQRDDAGDVNRAFFQPFGILQMGDGWYLRSTGVWNYDFETDNYSMPVGLGLGRVIITEPAVLNVFFEPQVAVATEGPGQREWGAFFGINFQLR